MRTAFATLALISSALSGCATAPRVQGAGPEAPPALRVWIGYPIGTSRVHPIFTNREAHVAMFEIIPGRGVTMVYPFHRGHRIASDAHYVDLTLQPGRMFYHTDPFGHSAHQPRYYYAVASVAPLNLTRLQSSLGAARRILGRMYSSYRPYDVIDRLTEIVVPMQSDEDWATDLFVDWPMPPMPIFASTRLIRCANGRVFHVPGNYPYHGCPGDSQLAVVASTVDPPKPPAPPRGGAVERPRAPRGGGNREGVELSNPGVDKRRRAEAGTRVPPTDARRPERARIHHSDRESGRASATSARGTSSAGSSSSGKRDAAGRASSDNSRSAEPSSSASPPDRSGGESSGSGNEKKPW